MENGFRYQVVGAFLEGVFRGDAARTGGYWLDTRAGDSGRRLAQVVAREDYLRDYPLATLDRFGRFGFDGVGNRFLERAHA